ncbi:MAG: (2Fe-2S)-binding protein [Rhodobacteraceae bacterium]|nr:(2Fe-2S)-binding protein [Paracoccaceae bacterium]
MPDPGAIVCSCFQIGIDQITAAVKDGTNTDDATGKILNAGTNCGSCKSETKTLLEGMAGKETHDDTIAKAG